MLFSFNPFLNASLSIPALTVNLFLVDSAQVLIACTSPDGVSVLSDVPPVFPDVDPSSICVDLETVTVISTTDLFCSLEIAWFPVLLNVAALYLIITS